MEDLVVNVEQGKLRGRAAKDVRGQPFYSFQGIPYAKPPLGKLRFRDPQPPDSWTGVRDATTQGSECYSRHMIFREKIIGSEDCLILNVYTPVLPKTVSEPLKSVMVWIHGGGFTVGSSNTDIYGPEYLVAEDVVLVTINYRLGILGFLNLEDESLGVPGNAGLKDMVQALKWVQKNIDKFSGDPSNVTIFGESAGGAAVQYLVLSPLAQGLFHKAITQSGSTLNRWARGRKSVALELGNMLGLPSLEKDILEHLEQLPVEKLPNEQLFFPSEKLPENAIEENVIRPFSPVVENPGLNAFLDKEPIQILKSGKYNQVPLMVGYTNVEGLLQYLFTRPHDPEVPRDFETTIPYFLGLPHGSSASKELAKKIKKFYFEEGRFKDETEGLFSMLTDTFISRDTLISAKHHSLTSSHPVYLYRMSLDADLNFFKKILQVTSPGACHADDLGYLFKTEILTHELKPGSIEDISVGRFTKLWTNFAKYGNPNPEKLDELIDVHWKPIEGSVVNFLDIGKELFVDVNPDAERLKFWEDIYSELKHAYSYTD